MEKEKKDIAEDLSTYVIERASQIDSDNQLQYYICGSVATMLLANATEIQECSLGINNTIELGTVKTISEDANKSLGLFQRTIGDLDIMNVNGSINNAPLEMDTNTGRNLLPFSPKMLRRIPNIEKLFKDGKIQFGNDSQTGLGELGAKYRVSRIKTINGNEFYVASPESIIAHKLDEIINIVGEGIINQKSNFSDVVKNKYPKDIKDIATSINGILKFYDKEKLSKDISDVLSEKSDSRFSQHQFLLPQILQIIDKDTQSYLETSGLQSEISLSEISDVIHNVLEQKKEKTIVSTTELGKETLEEQNDTSSKDETEKTMDSQIKSINKDGQTNEII